MKKFLLCIFLIWNVSCFAYFNGTELYNQTSVSQGLKNIVEEISVENIEQIDDLEKSESQKLYELKTVKNKRKLGRNLKERMLQKLKKNQKVQKPPNSPESNFQYGSWTYNNKLDLTQISANYTYINMGDILIIDSNGNVSDERVSQNFLKNAAEKKASDENFKIYFSYLIDTEDFREILKDDQKVGNFIVSSIAIKNTYGTLMDGVMIDWEPSKASQQEINAFTRICMVLSTQMKVRVFVDQNPNSTPLDIAALAEFVECFELQSYWNRTENIDQLYNIRHNWIKNQGVRNEQILIGIGLTSFGYDNVPKGNNPYEPGDKWYNYPEDGAPKYWYQLTHLLKVNTHASLVMPCEIVVYIYIPKDETTGSVYTYNPLCIMYYPLDVIRQLNLAGVFFWELEGDDSNNTVINFCHSFLE